MNTARVDALLIYNMLETRVQEIKAWLESHGVTTIDSQFKESDTFLDTACKILFIGQQGWTPDQLALAQKSTVSMSPVLHVLLDYPPANVLEMISSVFQSDAVIDLGGGDDNLPALQKHILKYAQRSPGEDDDLPTAQELLEVESTIRTLVDGNESQRHNVLTAVRLWKKRAAHALGARLRKEISDSFSPNQQMKFGAAVRDTRSLASSRSWMISVLLACDSTHVDTAALLQNELSGSYEPDQNVRFWALAACYWEKVPYLAELTSVAVHDSSQQVSLLASSINDPQHVSAVAAFKNRHDGDESNIWAVLRVMRVLPIPELAQPLCSLFDSALIETPAAYDVFYALANPVMASLAQPILEQKIGVHGVVERMLTVASNSYDVTVDHFTPILLTFDHAKVRAALSLAVTNGVYLNLARRVIRRFESLLHADGDFSLQIAGYSADTIKEQTDQLDIARDVQVLAAIMLSKGAPPPLAIGLFGNWGMGKSYFMRALHLAADELAARSLAHNSKQFCSNVIQIDFNAWHYADTNLWASLATSIFDGLNNYFDPEQSTAAKQTVAIDRVEQAKLEVSQAEAAQEEVSRQLLDSEGALGALKLQRHQGVIPISEFSLDDINTLIKDDENKEVLASVGEALKTLGLSKAIANVSDLQQVLGQAQNTFNRFVTLVRGLCSLRGLGIFLFLILLAMLGIPIFIDYVQRNFSLLVSATSAKVAQVATAVAAVAVWLRQATGIMQRGMAKIDFARKQVEDLLKRRKEIVSAEELALAAKIAELKTQEDAAAVRLSKAAMKVLELESSLSDLYKRSTLKHFLSERTKADDYRKHLGLIGTVRSDFEKLEQLIADQRLLLKDPLASDTQAENPKTVDRIVLYIDDLDRCPASQVVEVLQAVHLLLAYPLFVVVVGVDARWLLHSLKSHYQQLSGQGEGRTNMAWASSPQHYLEKIFQIPFALKPMDKLGYGKLIGQLMGKENSQPVVSRDDGGASDVSIATADLAHIAVSDREAMRAVPEPEGGVRPLDDIAAPVGSAIPLESIALTPAPVFMVAEDAMVVQAWEAKFAEGLYGFVASPRAAKRLSNIYRILKAGLLQRELQAFEGNNEVLGQFPVPMLLLAIMIYAPDAANKIFSGLQAGEQINILDLAEAVTQHLDRKHELVGLIADVVSQAGFPNDPQLFRYWAPRVARFSFGTA